MMSCVLTVPMGSSPHTSERGAYITTVVMEDGGKPRDLARHFASASARAPRLVPRYYFVTPLQYGY